MSTKLAWGIIGTGAIAKAFATGLAASRTGKLVAVGSRNQASADAFADQFKVPNRHATYESLLADPTVQAVYISTPHPLHAQWAIRAAQAGKHILCEKPFTINHAEAMAVVEAAHRHNVFLMEAFMYRCNPQTAKLVELLKAKAIGEVRVIQATFSFHAGFNADSRLFNNALGGGGILDVGGYTMSMSRLIAGAALGGDFADPLEVKGVGHLGQTGVDEWAAAVLKFPGEIIGQVATGVAVNQDNAVRVYGTEGRIVVPNPWVANRTAADKGLIVLHKKGEKEPQNIETQSGATSFSLEADAVADALAAGRREAFPPAMTWADTLGNMKALDRWRESIGLVYESEQPARLATPVSGQPLVFARHSQPAMKYGQLPGLKKKIARLVMGVDNQRIDQMPHAAAMFDDYFERGGNCFDSAYVYGGGRCEKALGQWIKLRGLRDQVVVFDKGAHTPHCNPAALTSQLLESLDRLGTDYIDLYMMHRDNPAIPVGEFVDVLNEHVKAGRIKVFGGSNWTRERVDEANAYATKKGLQGFVAVSNNFSLARMVDAPWGGCLASSEPAFRDWHVRTQTPCFSWSSQARGFFAGRARPDDRSDAELVRCWYSDDNFQRLARCTELAAKKGVAPVTIAAAYVLCQPFPTFALIGPRQISETRTSFDALAVELTAAEVKWLNLDA